MNPSVLQRENAPTPIKPNGEVRVLKEIETTISSLSSEKFTGEVVFRIHFNQGGIRNSKVTIEKPL